MSRSDPIFVPNLNPKPYRWTADPKRILEKLDRAWEALLEETYNPVYGT